MTGSEQLPFTGVYTVPLLLLALLVLLAGAALLRAAHLSRPTGRHQR